MEGATAQRDAPAAGEASLVRVPLEVSREPSEACRVLRGDDRPFALCGAWAGGGALLGSEPLRVAGAGADPFAVLSRQARVVDCFEGWPSDGDPAAAMPADAVGGGWFGYLGYRLGSLVERLRPTPPRPIPLPAFALAYYDHVLRRDASSRWWFEALWTPERDAELRRRHRLLAGRLATAPRGRRYEIGTFEPAAPGRDGYLEAVRQCRERIAAGEVFQANLCMRLEARFAGDPIDLFSTASARLEPCYAALVEGRDGTVVSLSPELFLRRRGRDVETRPIKGTAPRVGEPDRERTALTGSEKDRAENVMIVDLMRNDLGRVCEPGSVRVDELAEPTPAPGLWHLVSTVSGTLRPEADDEALLRASFPPGSVTGAPKIQSMRVISELEASGREVYTGAIGYASPIAGLELNVAIRTLELCGDRVWLGAGAGIVADSKPDAELRECLLKARPIVEAAGGRIRSEPRPPRRRRRALPLALEAGRRPDPELGVFETILVRGGRAIDIDAHLDRLADSVAALYEAALPRGVGERIAAEAGRWPAARLRVVAVGSAGAEPQIELTATALDAGESSPAKLCPVCLVGGLGAHKWRDRRLLDELARRSGAVPLIVDLDGEVLEAAYANVFWVEAGTLLTPPLDGRLRDGTVRAGLIASTREAGLEVREQSLTLDRLEAAEAILLTSSIRGVHSARLGGVDEQPDGPARPLSELGVMPYVAAPEPTDREPAAAIAGTGGRSSSTRIT